MPLFYRHPLPAKPKPVPGVMTIKQHRSWVCPMGVGLTIVVMGTIGLFLWQSSVQAIRKNRQIAIEQQLEELDKSRHQLEKAFQQNASLIAKNATLTAQNKEIRDQLAELTERVRTTQVEQKTYTSVLQSLSQSQEINQDLKEELNFYRRLLTSPKTSSENQAVTVANFTFNNYNKKSGRYPYKLVLTQWTKEFKVAEGIVKINIIGKAHGKTKRLKMNQITKNSVDSLKYELLYFRRIENELKLPKKFTPHHLIIRLLPKGEKKANEVRFKWKALQKRSN
jgi:uncharacterized membrane-anchored protein YhcB (DUF1043 family)